MKFIKKNKIKKINKLYKIEKYSYDLNKVAVIDPYNFNKIFLLENDILTKKTAKKTISKKSLISTYIPLRYVTTYELTIPRNLIDKIDVTDHIEVQAYEELELDEAEKYIFKYKLIDSIADEKNVIAEVIIVEEEKIRSYFEPLLESYDYIDYIGYSGFLFEVLYQKNILTNMKDIFLYFTKEYTLITLYSDGAFLQNIILNEGLNSLYDKLKEDKEIEIKNFNYRLFVELLTKKGLTHDYYDDNEEILFNKISEIFSATFMVLVNQLNSLQRKFALPTIDRIFITTEYGFIPGIIDFMHNYLNELEIKELKFDTKYNPHNVKIDQLLFLTLLSAQYAYEEDYQIDNLTIKKRPPTFFYRKSGQFISISVASLILSLLYPSYQYIDAGIKKYQNKIAEERLQTLTSTVNELSSLYSNLLKSYKNNEKIVKSKEKYINSVEKIITTLHREKKGYKPLSVLLVKIASYMQQNKIHTTDINLEKNILEFNIFAAKEYHITNFVSDLVKKEHLDVYTTGIIKDENSRKYLSVIKVNL